MIEIVKDRVAVTPIFDADTSKGGIIIPDIAKERCDQGIVKYVGKDVKDIKIGQYVLFSGYTGTLVHVEGEGSVIIMPEEFIVAVLSDVENVFVSGLYYKQKVDKFLVRQELERILEGVTVDPDSLSYVIDRLVSNNVRGPQSDPYYQADFENAMNLIADAFKDKQLDVKVPKPKWNKDGMVPV